MNDPAIVVLAGGKASRFPGKLDTEVEGEALLARVCRRLSEAGFPLYVAGSRPFLPGSCSNVPFERIADRWPGSGPLRAMLSAFEALAYERIALFAADQPEVDAGIVHALNAAWTSEVAAVVPRHPGGIEPLAALYARRPAIAGAQAGIAQNDESMHGLLTRLPVRYVPFDSDRFVNWNTPEHVRGLARSLR